MNSGSSRVVSGDDATVGEWPWQVQLNLVQPESGDLDFFCGGSLIDRQWVLTAGHCIIDDDHTKYLVEIGGIDRKKFEVSEQMFRVKRIIKHRLYNIGAPYVNDIALLQLSHKARVTPFVNTVCLPRQGEKVPPETKCFISGIDIHRLRYSHVPTLQNFPMWAEKEKEGGRKGGRGRGEKEGERVNK